MSAGEEGFEEGFGGLAGDGADLDLEEAGLAEEGVEGVFAEAEPDIGVELVGAFESVLLQVEDEELSAGAEDADGFVDGGLRMAGVVKGLAEDGEVDGGIGQGDGLDVAEFVGEVFEAVFRGELGADLDHAGGVVDAPDAGGAAGEKLRDEAFAGAEIGDVDAGRKTEGEVADGFPGAAGAVVLAELAGDEVEILFLVGAAFLEAAVEGVAVLLEFGQGGDGVAGGPEKGEGGRGEVGAEGVVGAFTVAAVDDGIGLAELGELRGDAGLAHAEDFLELGDGELLALKKGEDAKAGGVGEELEGVPVGVQRREGGGRRGG